MANSRKSIVMKQRDGVLFISSVNGSVSPAEMRDIKKTLDQPEIQRVIFYFDSKSDHENDVLYNVCDLVLAYSGLDAKIFRRKNILFSQRSGDNDDRMIRLPHAKIISGPKKFIYEGAVLKPKSRPYEILIDTIQYDQPRLVQISLAVKDNRQTTEDFLRQTSELRSLILTELQEENAIRTIQFFAYRDNKKELVDAYERQENFEITRCSINKSPASAQTAPSKRNGPVPVSKYRMKVLARQENQNQIAG